MNAIADDSEPHEDSVPTTDSYDEFSLQHWQNKTAAVTDEFIRLKFQLETFQRDKERDASVIESLKHEMGGITGRLAAVAVEHRENRNHWLAEKSELESRTFQMLALQTQYQGTMRKKEKDYEKLQGQLDKLVRDSQRGNKAVITVSKPLQKNSSQQKSAGTLLDAELTAAKSIIALLQHENDDLRAAVDGLAQSVQTLQEEIVENEIQREKEFQQQQVAQEMQKQLQQSSRPFVTFSEIEGDGHFVTAPSTPSISDPSSDLRRKEEQSEEMTYLSFMDNEKDSNSNNIDKEEECSVVREGLGVHFNSEPLTPSTLPHCLNDATTEGTPSARPVRWMVGQVSTEVKRLRERADRANDSAFTPKANNSCERMNLKKKLSEAFAVIEEQDRLIHHALFGHITGLYDTTNGYQNNFSSDRRSLSPDSDAFSPMPKFASTSTSCSTAKRSGKSDDPFSDFDLDFLPPASPATMELLKAHNWPVLPRESMKERSAAKECSAISIFKEHSPMISAKKNILHSVQDTLASLLSFSPDVGGDPRSVLLARTGVVNFLNSEIDSVAANDTQSGNCAKKEKNDISHNNGNSGSNIKSVSKKTVRQSIPVYKRILHSPNPASHSLIPIPAVVMRTTDNDENINRNFSSLENKIKKINSNERKNKIPANNVSLVGREISEKEHKKSHKKLIIGKEIYENQSEESTGPRILDMNEI